MRTLRVRSLAAVITAGIALSGVAAVAIPASAARPSAPPIVDDAPQPGAKRLHFEAGPFEIKPGQNNIGFLPGVDKPKVDGYITAIHPDLKLKNGKTPGVDVVHLHHGVWLNQSAKDATMGGPERFFAAGEEKTTMILPKGYGYAYKATDVWVLNYMIHNLWPKPQKVWMTYDLDFIPATSKAAQSITPASPVWMDIQNGQIYPVFDAIKGAGTKGTYTYPDQEPDAYAKQASAATPPGRRGFRPSAPRNVWTVDQDRTIIATAGHLHPGGLRNDLYVTRAGATAPKANRKPGTTDTARLWRSDAVYYEPAGAVSWDVSMTATPLDYRVSLKKGDVLSTTVTYDTKDASWYESMGIMVVWTAPTKGIDPFKSKVPTKAVLTHGHLPENDNHGGGPAGKDYINALKVRSSPEPVSNIPIEDFVYARGDMSLADNIPTVAAGQSITFDNSLDAPKDNGIWHTITACKAPCNRSTGIAYPRADASVQFDSGELGIAGSPTANRLTWQTPSTLSAGTYTYFCRIHPFMRGAFRVTKGASTSGVTG
jgi:plastocyanin